MSFSYIVEPIGPIVGTRLPLRDPDLVRLVAALACAPNPWERPPEFSREEENRAIVRRARALLAEIDRAEAAPVAAIRQLLHEEELGTLGLDEKPRALSMSEADLLTAILARTHAMHAARLAKKGERGQPCPRCR